MTLLHPIITKELVDDDRAHDPWGSTLATLGAICDVLSVMGGEIPASAGYRPAMGLSHPNDLRWNEVTGENYNAHILLTGLDTSFDPGLFTEDYEPDLATDDLEYAARVLDRYADVLKLAGRDY